MLQANEIRIGNVFDLLHAATFLSISTQVIIMEIGTDNVSVLFASTSSYNAITFEKEKERLNPIKINKHLLEAIGFVAKETVDQWKLKKNEQFFIERKEVLAEGILVNNYILRDTHSDENIEVLHLHQLQNLYMDKAGLKLSIPLLNEAVLAN